MIAWYEWLGGALVLLFVLYVLLAWGWIQARRGWARLKRWRRG